MSDANSNLPSVNNKPSLLDWLEAYFHLPFKLPRIPLVQTAKNLDKAAASIVTAAGDNAVARIRASTTRIDAMSTAEKVFIEFGQRQIEQSPNEIANRALEYALGDAVQKQENREEVLRIAGEQLAAENTASDATEEIDDDWLNSFRRYAETKSNADIQQLWGKILSTEIRRPGSTSLRTLDFLSTVSMNDARRIVDLFRYVINGIYIPEWVHTQNLISYQELLALQEIGVIAGGLGTGTTAADNAFRLAPGRVGKASASLQYFDKLGLLDTDDEGHHLRFPTTVLTEVGRTLFAIADTKAPDYKYFEDFLSQLGKSPIKQISIADVLSRETGFFKIGPERILYPLAPSG